MTGIDYCANPVLRARLDGRLARIKNRETREDALQEAFCDILTLSPIDLDEAIKVGSRAIHRVETREARYISRHLSPIEDNAVPSTA